MTVRELQSILVGSIIVADERRRLVQEPVVARLVGSLPRRGLLSPIRVLSDGTLVCGLHRLVAHERLGWTEIDALVCDGDAVEIELDEIEENLCRKELTVLERARDERRQKELYLVRNPETRRGVAGALAKHEGRQAKPVSFAEQRATEVGGNRRMVEQRVQIATLLGDEAIVQLATSSVADNHRQLLELARLPDSIRGEVVNRIADGRAEKVKQAIAQVTRPEPPVRAPREREAEGVLVQTDTGFRGEVVLQGRRVLVEFDHDHEALFVEDAGSVSPAVVNKPAPDTRRFTLELSFDLIHEVLGELPSDLARDVAASQVMDDPAMTCAGCGASRYFLDAIDRCAVCNPRLYFFAVEPLLETFWREHSRRRQVISIWHPDRTRHLELEITWSRGPKTTGTWWIASCGWEAASIPETQTLVELRATACRRTWSIESCENPGAARFKAALCHEVLRIMKATHGLQQRGERFFRCDGSEVVITRRQR